MVDVRLLLVKVLTETKIVVVKNNVSHHWLDRCFSICQMYVMMSHSGQEFMVIIGRYLKNFKNKQLWDKGVLVESHEH